MNGPILEWKHQTLADGDVHFDAVTGRQRANVREIKRVTVGVLLAVLTVKRERDSGAFTHSSVNGVQPTEDFLERYLFEQCEIEIFREPVVVEIATLQGRSALESQSRLEVRLRKHRQKPCQTVVAFEHILADAAAAAGCQAVRQQRDVSLWNHFRSCGLLRVLLERC